MSRTSWDLEKDDLPMGQVLVGRPSYHCLALPFKSLATFLRKGFSGCYLCDHSLRSSPVIGVPLHHQSGTSKFDSWPIISLIRQVISPAFTIAILAAIESLLFFAWFQMAWLVVITALMHWSAQVLGISCHGPLWWDSCNGCCARTAANVKNGGRSTGSGYGSCLHYTKFYCFSCLTLHWFLWPVWPQSLMIVGYNMSGWHSWSYDQTC